MPWPRDAHRPGAARLLVRACHPGPTIAVTLLAVLLARAAGAGPTEVATVAVAVLAGQLSIGWSNDLLDVHRDRAVGRTDKPVATGALAQRTIRTALAVSVLVAVPASYALGPVAGPVHLVAVVGAGWAYNLGLKRTVASFVPYAVAFGTLPAVAQLTAHPDRVPPVWLGVTGALLGVGAHLVNALPDLAADAATGVVGLPHRLGERGSRWLAAVLLTAGTWVAAFGPGRVTSWWVWLALVAAVVLAAAVLVGRGTLPFRAAMLIALVDVVVLVNRAGVG